MVGLSSNSTLALWSAKDWLCLFLILVRLYSKQLFEDFWKKNKVLNYWQNRQTVHDCFLTHFFCDLDGGYDWHEFSERLNGNIWRESLLRTPFPGYPDFWKYYETVFHELRGTVVFGPGSWCTVFLHVWPSEWANRSVDALNGWMDMDGQKSALHLTHNIGMNK